MSFLVQTGTRIARQVARNILFAFFFSFLIVAPLALGTPGKMSGKAVETQPLLREGPSPSPTSSMAVGELYPGTQLEDGDGTSPPRRTVGDEGGSGVPRRDVSTDSFMERDHRHATS